MPSNVCLIVGDDEYVVSAKAEEIVHSHVSPENVTLGLETIDGDVDTVDNAVQAIDLCISAILTQGMFAASKVVWFRNVSFLTDSVVGRSENVKPRINRLAEIITGGLPPGTTLVISANGADKRYALYKAIKQNGKVSEFSVPAKAQQADRAAGEKLRDLAAERGLQMSGDAQAAFVERTGTNTRQMVSELDKLSVYMGERKRVQVGDIQTIVSSSRESIAWDLADAFGKRQLPRALGLMKQLLFQKESGIRLVISIESRIRDLMLYKEGLQRKWIGKGYGNSSGMAWGNLPDDADKVFSEELERDPRSTHPYRVGLLAAQAQGFSRSELRRCQQLALASHEQLVSSSMPESIILEIMLVNMLS